MAPHHWQLIGSYPIFESGAATPEACDFSRSGQNTVRGYCHRCDRVDYHTAKVPLTGMIQVNVLDPDGNHIEVQFEATEAGAALGAEDRYGDAAPCVPTRSTRKVKRPA